MASADSICFNRAIVSLSVSLKDVEEEGIVMIWLIGLLPTALFLVFMPVLETVIAQKDRYRTQSVYGFRSTRAVKNPENWRKAQLAVRDSSFVFGGIQLVFTLLICSWSEDLFLIANAVFLGVLLGIQFFYVNSRLD